MLISVVRPSLDMLIGEILENGIMSDKRVKEFWIICKLGIRAVARTSLVGLEGGYLEDIFQTLKVLNQF